MTKTTERTTEVGTFTLERVYPATPARVFAAFADRHEKEKWASCHEGAEHTLDFRVGGREIYRGGPKGGPVFTNTTHFYDVVPNERIVFAYEMLKGQTRVSVSLTTIELRPEGKGTRLVFTEQTVMLDGQDTVAQRKHGTAEGLDRLGEELAAEASSSR